MAERSSGRLRAASALAGLGGAALFVWSIRQAGTPAVIDGVRRIGAGIIVVCVLGGLRGLARAAAWRLCLGPNSTLGLGTVFSAYLAGDAIGNVTPFGFLISEPSKIVLLRPRIDAPASVAALTVENLVYSATVVVVLVAGTIGLMAFAVPRPLRIASVAVLVVAAALAGVAAWITARRRRLIGGAFASLMRTRVADRYSRRWLPRIQQTGEAFEGFVARSRSAALPLIALEASYHIAAVAEIWFALGLITGAPPDLLTAFVLEYINRTITVGFQFVPMWLGVDEAGTSLATNVLGLGSAAGVSLALARKARVAVWTAIGIALLLHRGLSVRTVAHETGVTRI